MGRVAYNNNCTEAETILKTKILFKKEQEEQKWSDQEVDQAVNTTIAAWEKMHQLEP